MSKLEERIAEIDTLTAKSGEIAAAVKNEYHEQIEEFKRAWGDLKSGIEPAWTALIF